MEAGTRVWPWGRSKARTDAARLVDIVSGVSRRPSLYGPGRIADTLEGRLEALMLHAGLAMIRLRDEPEAAPLAQAFADALFRHIDSGLREAAVGDLAVPRRMRKIAGQFYGRLEAYTTALAPAETGALEAALTRNILGPEAAGFAPALAAWASEARRRLAEAPVSALFHASVWGDAAP